VRAFDARTGAPGPSVSLAAYHPAGLAGIAAGPDGSLYVTDRGPDDAEGASGSGARADRIFRIGRNHAVTVALASDSLEKPSGIVWDPHGKRFVIVSFGGSAIQSWRIGDAQPRTIGNNRAQMDGVAILPDGRMLVTSWRDSSLTIRAADKLTSIKGFPLPGHVGVDTRRGRVAIPLLAVNRVDIWSIPPIAQ
jgi:sugar lactone lactonase YvrE